LHAVAHLAGIIPRDRPERNDGSKGPATKDGEAGDVGLWKVPDSGDTPQRHSELASDDRNPRPAIGPSRPSWRKGKGHEQPACRAEPGTGRAAHHPTATAGRPGAAGAWQSPAGSPASIAGGPWLVAASPLASRRRPAAIPSPEPRQLIDRRQPCPNAPVPSSSGPPWQP
jgi:hypothetical protein